MGPQVSPKEYPRVIIPKLPEAPTTIQLLLEVTALASTTAKLQDDNPQTQLRVYGLGFKAVKAFIYIYIYDMMYRADDRA